MEVDFTMSLKLADIEHAPLDKAAAAIAQVMLAHTRKQFIEGGLPRGWEPLAVGGPSYLFQSGTLLQSIEAGTAVEGDEYIAKTIAGQGLPYAAIHQFGGYTGRNHAAYIPARPYLVFTDEMIEDIKRESIGLVAEAIELAPMKEVVKADEF